MFNFRQRKSAIRLKKRNHIKLTFPFQVQSKIKSNNPWESNKFSQHNILHTLHTTNWVNQKQNALNHSLILVVSYTSIKEKLKVTT